MGRSADCVFWNDGFNKIHLDNVQLANSHATQAGAFSQMGFLGWNFQFFTAFSHINVLAGNIKVGLKCWHVSTMVFVWTVRGVTPSHCVDDGMMEMPGSTFTSFHLSTTATAGIMN